MDSADFENSSPAIAMPRGLGSAQRVVIAVGVDAQARALAVDDLDGVAFTGSDWVEHCLAVRPSCMCRSVPQMALELSRTMTSVESSSTASSTSWTSTVRDVLVNDGLHKRSTLAAVDDSAGPRPTGEWGQRWWLLSLVEAKRSPLLRFRVERATSDS